MFTMNWGEISLAVWENISDLKHCNALVKSDRRRVEQTEICKMVEKKTAPFCREYHWVQILYFFCTYNFQIMLLIQYLKVSCKCQNIPEVEVLVFVRAWDCKPADFGELSWCHFGKRKLARGGHVLELGWWVKMESRSYVNSGVAPLLPETTTLLRILLLPFEPVFVVGQFENCLTLVKTCEAGVTQAPSCPGSLITGRRRGNSSWGHLSHTLHPYECNSSLSFGHLSLLPA